MEIWDFLIIVLATWRLATFFVSEEGPFNIFRRWREALGIKHGDDGTIVQIPEKTLPKLFSCLWCMSVWMALASYGLWIVCPVLVWILAISTGAILIERLRGG